MAVNKIHDEFRTIDMSSGWETPMEAVLPGTSAG